MNNHLVVEIENNKYKDRKNELSCFYLNILFIILKKLILVVLNYIELIHNGL